VFLDQTNNGAAPNDQSVKAAGAYQGITLSEAIALTA
jgi:hypothetical protein